MALELPRLQHAAPSSGCPCLRSLEGYGIEQGSALVVVIDGAAHNYRTRYGVGACAAHDFDTQPYCTAAEFVAKETCTPKVDPPLWCLARWCYVDGKTCNVTSTATGSGGMLIRGLVDPNKTLHYSYTTCDACDAVTMQRLKPGPAALSPVANLVFEASRGQYTPVDSTDEAIKHQTRFLVGVSVISSVLGLLLLCFVCYVSRAWRQHRRTLVEAESARLRYVGTTAHAHPFAAPTDGFHIFLSHVWTSGANQMRIAKERLKMKCPDLLVFLECVAAASNPARSLALWKTSVHASLARHSVDDLKGGRGAEFVDRALMFCIFVSEGYFDSPNCVRELLRAALTDKTIVALFESDRKQGSLTVEEATRGLSDALARLPTWGLVDELRQWGHEPPSFETLRAKVFEHPPIEWSNIPVYRDTALRLLAEPVLEPRRGTSRGSPGLGARRTSKEGTERRQSSVAEASEGDDTIAGIASSARMVVTRIDGDGAHPRPLVARLPALITADTSGRMSDLAVCVTPRTMDEAQAASIIAAAARGRNSRILTSLNQAAKTSKAAAGTAAGKAHHATKWGIARANSRAINPALRLMKSLGQNSEASETFGREDSKTAIRQGQRTYMTSDPSHSAHRHKLRPAAPRGKHTHHIYCSSKNMGAAELVEQLQAFLAGAAPDEQPQGSSSRDEESSRLDRASLRWTTDLEALSTCQHMLLYLNKATWTSGQHVSEKLAYEVMLAKKFGVHLLLAHEQPNVADELDDSSAPRLAQLGVPFDAFFNNYAGTTPKQLVVFGIYDEIAVPLKGGDFRPVSMALLAKAVITKPAELVLLHRPNISSDSMADRLSEGSSTVDDILLHLAPHAHARDSAMSRLVGQMTKVRNRRAWAMEEFGVPHNPVPAGLRSVTDSRRDTRHWGHLQDDAMTKQREILALLEQTPAHVRFAKKLIAQKSSHLIAQARPNLPRPEPHARPRAIDVAEESIFASPRRWAASRWAARTRPPVNMMTDASTRQAAG